MALSYTDLSEDLGKLIKYYNAFYTTAQGLDTIVDALCDEFNDANSEAAISGLRPDAETGWRSEYAGRRGILASYAERRLTDRLTVVQEVGAVNEDLAEVLSKLIEQMITDSQTINASAGAVGSVTANAGNVGNGTVLASVVLDGFSSPGQRAGVSFAAHRKYRGLSSELVIAEPHVVKCLADSYADKLTEGAETFSWEGRIADTQHGVEASEGTGAIANVTAIHGNTAQYFSNADFEDFTTANTPDNWTIDAGTAGIHVFSDATANNFYHALSALKFSGTGAQASIQVSQAPASGVLDAGRRYCFTCRIKASATIAAGALTIQFEGTGYTAGASEKVSIAAASLPTSWTLQNFFVNIPVSIPSDFKLVIKWTGTPTNAKSLWVDDVGFAPVNFGAGMGLVVVRGSTPFVRNDSFTFATTNTEGVIQKFFRRVFGVQLPSDGAAGETILDSVAA